MSGVVQTTHRERRSKAARPRRAHRLPVGVSGRKRRTFSGSHPERRSSCCWRTAKRLVRCGMHNPAGVCGCVVCGPVCERALRWKRLSGAWVSQLGIVAAVCRAGVCGQHVLREGQGPPRPSLEKAESFLKVVACRRRGFAGLSRSLLAFTGHRRPLPAIAGLYRPLPAFAGPRPNGTFLSAHCDGTGGSWTTWLPPALQGDTTVLSGDTSRNRVTNPPPVGVLCRRTGSASDLVYRRIGFGGPAPAYERCVGAAGLGPATFAL